MTKVMNLLQSSPVKVNIMGLLQNKQDASDFSAFVKKLDTLIKDTRESLAADRAQLDSCMKEKYDQETEDTRLGREINSTTATKDDLENTITTLKGKLKENKEAHDTNAKNQKKASERRTEMQAQGEQGSPRHQRQEPEE